MRPEAEFHPIWGAAAPTVGLVRMIVFAVGVGAAAGAATFWSLLDQHQARPARSMAAPRADSRAVSYPTTASSLPTATENSETANSLPLPVPNTSAEIPSETSATNLQTGSPALKPEAQTLTDLHAFADRPACNVSLCEQYYQSFRSSDCTYQPYSGPRQYCTR